MIKAIISTITSLFALLFIIFTTPAAMGASVYAEHCKRNPECRVLAEAGYYEARSEPDVGVVSVMHVVLNRVKTPGRWGSTIKDVVYARKQFTYTTDGSLRQGMREKKQVERMLEFAYDVLHGNIESPVGKATHYHTTSVSPNWGLPYVMHVGNHIFYL